MVPAVRHRGLLGRGRVSVHEPGRHHASERARIRVDCREKAAAGSRGGGRNRAGGGSSQRLLARSRARGERAAGKDRTAHRICVPSPPCRPAPVRSLTSTEGRRTGRRRKSPSLPWDGRLHRGSELVFGPESRTRFPPRRHRSAGQRKRGRERQMRSLARPTSSSSELTA